MNAKGEIKIEAKDVCNEFWDTMESIKNFVVPTYVRNILKVNAFDSAGSVQLIDEDSLTKIDNFAKYGGMERTLPINANLSDFYGPFLNSKEDFHILQGHRKILLNISAFIREKGLQNIMELMASRSTNYNTMHDETGNTFSMSLDRNNYSNMNFNDSTIASSIISSASIYTSSILSEKTNQSNSLMKVQRQINRISVRRNCAIFESPVSCKTVHTVKRLNTINNRKPKVNAPCNSSNLSKENRPMKRKS